MTKRMADRRKTERRAGSLLIQTTQEAGYVEVVISAGGIILCRVRRWGAGNVTVTWNGLSRDGVEAAEEMIAALQECVRIVKELEG